MRVMAGLIARRVSVVGKVSILGWSMVWPIV